MVDSLIVYIEGTTFVGHHLHEYCPSASEKIFANDVSQVRKYHEVPKARLAIALCLERTILVAKYSTNDDVHTAPSPTGQPTFAKK